MPSLTPRTFARKLQVYVGAVACSSLAMTIWLSPNTPVAFVYQGNRRPQLNRAWLEDLALMANSVGGLMVVPEPPADDPTVADVPEALRAGRTGTGSPRAGS